MDLSNEAFVSQTRFGVQDVAGVVDGAHYAAVIGYPVVHGIFYNKDVFPAPGQPIPTSLDELYEACGDFYASGQDGAFLYVAGGDYWPLDILPRLLWADAVKAGLIDEVNAGTTTFADPRFVEGINALNSAIYRGCLNADDIRTATYEDGLARLIDGRAALIAQGSWALDDLIDAYGLDLVNEKVGFLPLSFSSPLATWRAAREGSFLVSRNEDPLREAAALAFIRFATGEGYAQYLADSEAPPVLEGYDPPEGVPTALLEADAALEAGAAPDLSMSLLGPYSMFTTYLSEMIDGYKTPTDVAVALARDAEAWFAR